MREYRDGRVRELDPVWGEIAEFFRPAEFNYPEAMAPDFLRLLFRIRSIAGVPFRITSDHRPPERNEDAGGAKGSAHLQDPCMAVDLSVRNNYERARIVLAAVECGITRLGIYPAREDGSGVVHLDGSMTHPTPRIWTRW